MAKLPERTTNLESFRIEPWAPVHGRWKNDPSTGWQVVVTVERIEQALVLLRADLFLMQRDVLEALALYLCVHVAHVLLREATRLEDEVVAVLSNLKDMAVEVRWRHLKY